MQIKEDVERHRDLINEVSRDIKAFNTLNMNVQQQDEEENKEVRNDPTVELNNFMATVDRRLSCLVDEHAVLKNFETFPEAKLDVLREANGLSKDLRKIESDFKIWGAQTWEDIAIAYQHNVAEFSENDDKNHDNDDSDDRDEKKKIDVVTPLHTTKNDATPKFHDILAKATKILDSAQPRLDEIDRNEEQRKKKYAAHSIRYDSSMITNTKHCSVHMASALIGSALVLINTRKKNDRPDNSEPEDFSNVVTPALKVSYRIYQLASGFDENAAALFDMLCDYS